MGRPGFAPHSEGSNPSITFHFSLLRSPRATAAPRKEQPWSKFRMAGPLSHLAGHFSVTSRRSSGWNSLYEANDTGSIPHRGNFVVTPNYQMPGLTILNRALSGEPLAPVLTGSKQQEMTIVPIERRRWARDADLCGLMSVTISDCKTKHYLAATRKKRDLIAQNSSARVVCRTSGATPRERLIIRPNSVHFIC